MSLSDPLRLKTLTIAVALESPGSDTVAEKVYYTDDARYHLGAREEFGRQLSLNARINNLLVENRSARSCDLTVAGDT